MFSFLIWWVLFSIWHYSGGTWTSWRLGWLTIVFLRKKIANAPHNWPFARGPMMVGGLPYKGPVMRKLFQCDIETERRIYGSAKYAIIRPQPIIWTKVGILLLGPLGTYFSEILIDIYIFSFKKMHLKLSSGNWWPFCLGLNLLTGKGLVTGICISKLGHHWIRLWLFVWVMARPLTEPMLLYHQLGPKGQFSVKLLWQICNEVC